MPGGRKPKYDEATRAAALAALVANAGNVTETARQLGLPRNTLADWAKAQAALESPPPVAGEFPAPKKGLTVTAGALEAAVGDLRERLERVVDLMAADLARPEKIAGASLSQVATAFGIAFDKLQLLKGLPTSNSQVGVLTMTYEELCRLPPDELIRIHRQTLGLPAGRDRG